VCSSSKVSAGGSTYPIRHRTGPASRGIARPFRVSVRSWLAPVLVRRAPRALRPDGLGFRGFTCRGRPRCTNVHHGLSSHGLVRSFRVHRASSRRSATAPSRVRSDVAAPPMRFAPLQRVPAHGSSIVAGFASPGRLRPQVFATSRRVSIHREPAGLVSCRIRSWGCTLQSFVPTTWPYAVSGADPLLALVPARHHLDIPLPFAPAKAEASSSRDSRGRSARAETLPDRTSCRPSRRSRSPAEPTGRPTLERRSALRARQWLCSPSAEAPFEPSGLPTHRRRSTAASSRARLC
jgi:hypothetical protein